MPTWSGRLAAVCGLIAVIVLPPLLATSSARPAAEPLRPRLAVLVVIDQLRGDYPERWGDLFGQGGFRRLERDGAWFTHCHYAYANTVTGPGHASVATGCSPDKHGIINNDWFDRASKAEVNCVESERYERVPAPPREEAKASATGEKKAKKYTGVAPDRLLAPTLADALKEASGGKARVVALSFKDRGAVLLGGRHPDACYWFDSADGLFVTSTYYRDRSHPWVADFNAHRPADRWFGQEWTRLRPDLDYERFSSADDAPGEGKGAAQGMTFPHSFDGGPKKLRRTYYSALFNSPFGNDLLLELAQHAIHAEQLGSRDVPDLLCLSFSSNDAVGHVWGPDSQEVLDITLRTDLLLKDLLATLDAEVGPGRYVLALTADHGVCPLPEAARARGDDAGRVPPALLKDRANAFLVTRFGGDTRTRYIAAAIHPWIYLNRDLLQTRGFTTEEVADALAAWLERQDGVQRTYTHTQLVQGPDRDDRLGQMMRLSFDPERCGDVAVVLKPYHILYDLTGTTHGSPYTYDTHVPLMVYGPGVKAGVRADPVRPQAVAAILARALGVEPPPRYEEAVPDELFATQ